MRTKAGFLVLLVLLLTLALASTLSAECYTYNNSSPADYPMVNGGYACSGTGPGCQQCVTYYSWGFKVCTYDWYGGFTSCYTYGGPPENQI